MMAKGGNVDSVLPGSFKNRPSLTRFYFQIVYVQFNHGESFLLTLGTLEPRKNLSVLLEAYALVRSTRPEAPDLVVVGGSGWGDVDANSMAAEFWSPVHQVALVRHWRWISPASTLACY